MDAWYGAKGADELAERFTKTLSPTSPLPLEKCSRFSRPDVITRFKKSLYVCNVWIRDFFRMRGDLAHGKVTPQDTTVLFPGSNRAVIRAKLGPPETSEVFAFCSQRGPLLNAPESYAHVAVPGGMLGAVGGTGALWRVVPTPSTQDTVLMLNIVPVQCPLRHVADHI